MRKLLLSVTCLACAFPAVLAAQSDKAFIAYFTLLETPPGALPPTLSMPMVNRLMTSTDVSLRYGYTSLSGVSLHTLGLTVGVPAGTKAAIGLTAGYQGVRCDGGGCDGHFVASAKAEGRLSSSPLGTTPNSPVLNFGLNGEFGFGKPSGGSLYSITAGVPIALVANSPTLRIAPFLTPGFGFGSAHGGGESQSGTRFLLGGGLTIQNMRNAIAVNLGFQKIFIDQGDTMVGLSVSFGVK
jgi:hypothetical protein